jgi:hypothetical protein
MALAERTPGADRPLAGRSPSGGGEMKKLWLAPLATFAFLLASCEDEGNPGDDNLLTGGSLILVVLVVVIVVLLVRRRR